MDVEPPPKCVNEELNSQIGIRGQDSHFSESDGAPPTSMLLWGVAHRVRYVKRDANNSLCIIMVYCCSWVRHCRTYCNSTDHLL